MLRTSVSNRRSNNGLHGGTSISWNSPPFLKLILKGTTPPVKGEKEFLRLLKIGTHTILCFEYGKTL
jgi:hypothetical protein